MTYSVTVSFQGSYRRFLYHDRAKANRCADFWIKAQAVVGRSYGPPEDYFVHWMPD